MINQPMPPTQTPGIGEKQIIRLEAFKERLKKREIWINGPLDETLVEKLYINLIDLEAQSNVIPLTVVINSTGGNFFEAIVGTDIMGTLNCPVKTIALANACSGGFILFMGGQERIVHDYSCLMMHSIGFGVVDKVPDVAERLEYIEQAQTKMAKFFAYQTRNKTTSDYWEKLFKSGKDKWFSVDEALKLGIAHKVIRRPEMINPDFNVRKPYTWDLLDIVRSQQ